ncbi:MAG: GGDEF domain-containing protein [Myxococcales bacterium]|nr:GGDEF domain-containing protein [Myxococcales bacterium]
MTADPRLTPTQTAPNVDELLDTLCGVVRDFGRHAFDLSRQDARRTQQLFDQWAQHLASGVEPPGGVGRTGTRRDYPGLRRAFSQHRQAEHAELGQLHDALREVVWAFVGGLNRLVTDDAADDATVTASLSGLALKLGTTAPLEIRSVALEAVAQVHAVFEARRARQLTQLLSLGEKLEQLGSQLETARNESTTDALTQLYNRRAFDEQLVRTVELASLRAGGAALLMIDLDHFKQLNDTFGHPGGDAVLSAVAQACVRVFKGKGDFVARYGGEELAVLMRDVDVASTSMLAEKLRAAIAALEVKHDARVMRVTASIGAAYWTRGESAEAWLARADAALFSAKGAGRNRVVTA